MAKQFTDENFKTEVLDHSGLSVVDFWAEWCGPCKVLGPVIEQLSTDYAGRVNIGKLDVDQNSEISTEYGISSIPAVLFFKNGQLIDKVVGAQPKSNFVKKIEEHI